MSDRMTPIPFPALMEFLLAEHEAGSVFGLKRVFHAGADRLALFGEGLETPFGPAAGPHTQLAQNIIAAYVAGARFFELKTVQTLDGEDLPVSKPCILAEDEGYNVEWSTELRAEEAITEYIKAWFALKLISREWGLGAPDGFIFNMSVGYDYAGITSEKIDFCIESLRDARINETFSACRDWAMANRLRFSHIDADDIERISPQVIRSITLSTLHGCPPAEIERIASYLISEKKLHTFVKCNPTLLGYDFARRTLDRLGYGYVSFDAHHFNEDLQYRDAVPMFRRLMALAADNGVSFGLKLSNTFPVEIRCHELPGSEMYMSGCALYPLTVEMASRIAHEFDGQLRISFSGGADYFNIAALADAGIWPVTLATTLLKPGGYQRLTQLAEEFSLRPLAPYHGVSVSKTAYLAKSAQHDARHEKAVKPAPSRKLPQKVPLIDCFLAPCAHGCPIGQDIPAYVALVGAGRHADALRLILEKNPLPFITGSICAHRCMDKCTRNFYEESVHIRDAKLRAARLGFDEVIGTLKPEAKRAGRRVAVVGGGPAGMAAAFFLARQGADVTLYEKQPLLGGLVRYVIPPFRIADCGIDHDVQLLLRMGVSVRCGEAAPSCQALKDAGFDAVVYGVGAEKPGRLAVEGGNAINALDFLAQYKNDTFPAPGKNVVVIGGGNTAMDAARAAKRIRGVQNVYLVYRRTRRYMPADGEELALSERDGVTFMELLSPVRMENGALICMKMALGAPDESGRRSPVETGETCAVPCDTLIAAVGEKADGAFFVQNGIPLDRMGRVKVDPDTLMTDLPNVYCIGDAHRGPATVVEGIADARRAADAIIGKYEAAKPCAGDCAACYAKQGILAVYDNAEREAGRCLGCDTVCTCCVQVCPNRANAVLEVEGLRMPQILHIDRMCNECGNCVAFCPYDSAPYRDKLTLFSAEKDFDTSENKGFYFQGDGRVKLRLDETGVYERSDKRIPADVKKIMDAVLQRYAYLLN